MENQLSFGADCVIKFQDLGDFKDYSETIQSLVVKLLKLKEQKKPLFCAQLQQVMEADPQDTFYIPSFKQLLEIIIDQNWIKYQLKGDQLRKILKFQMTLIEDCLLSFTFTEQTAKTLLLKCASYKDIHQFQNLLLRTIFNLSEKVVYIQDEQSVIALWNCLKEDVLFDISQVEMNNMKAAVYFQCCQKFMRNHRIRKRFNVIAQNERSILRAKLSLWNRDKSSLQECKQIFFQKNYFGSSFLKKMIHFLEAQLNK